MAKTVYDLLEAAAKLDGSPTANEDIRAEMKKHGHDSGKTAGCTETIMSMFYSIGAIDIIGGYKASSAPLMENAKSKGLWHPGPKGILPGDIVVFGRNGKSNHTELAVGAEDDVSGNYTVSGVTGCSRRKRSSHSSDIFGYIRPRYAAMPEMDNLQITVAAADCILDVYGSGGTRKEMLSVFGAKNAEKIQAEVDRIWNDPEKTAFDLAVYVIAGHAGKCNYRKKRLGKWADKAQAKIDEIKALGGKTVEQAALLVLADRFSTGAVRRCLLEFCGYDAEKVQAAVNKACEAEQKAPAAPSVTARFRVYPVWFFEKDESAYGDCTAVIEYDQAGRVAHCVLVDTAMNKTASLVVKKLKAQGVTQIDAIIISHGHGDHYGGASAIMKAIPVKSVYIPDTAGLDKYQKTYANALRRQAAKARASVTMKAGESYQIGGIRFKCIWQAPAGKLSVHDTHYFVNNQSAVLRFDLGGAIFHTAGDLQNEGNRLLIAAVEDLKAHIYKCQWHGDANACNEAICKAVRPAVAFSDYHHKEGSGRGTTRKRLEAVGASVFRNYEDGDIFIDCEGGKITVTTTKSKKNKVFKL